MPSHTSSRLIGLIAAILSLPIAGCFEKTPPPAPPPPPDVIVSHPVKKEITDFLQYTGNTEAFQEVELRARVQGFLTEVLFKPGGEVKKDQLLFVIDKRPFQAAVDAAVADLAQTKAQLVGAEADARIAAELFSQSAGSEIDKINKEAKRDSLKAAIGAADAALEKARLDLEFCEVRAPFNGRITKNFVDVGNLVGRTDATLLATLVTTQPVYASVDASESDMLTIRRRYFQDYHDNRMEPGQISPGTWRPVFLSLADEADFKTQGRIDYVNPALSTDTATIRVRTIFENEDGFLLPGMFVQLRFPVNVREALLVPQPAVLQDQAGFFVLLVNEKGIVEQRRVKAGRTEGTLRVVDEGLTSDDRVVVNGVQKARPGLPVSPKLEAITLPPSAPVSSETGATRGGAPKEGSAGRAGSDASPVRK